MTLDKPEFYGVLSTGTRKDPKRIGKIAVWHQPNRYDQQPCFEGHIDLDDGTRIHVALWQKGQMEAIRHDQ